MLVCLMQVKFNGFIRLVLKLDIVGFDKIHDFDIYM